MQQVTLKGAIANMKVLLENTAANKQVSIAKIESVKQRPYVTLQMLE